MFIILKDVDIIVESYKIILDRNDNLRIFYPEDELIIYDGEYKPYLPNGNVFKGYPKVSYKAIITAIEAGRPSIALNLNLEGDKQ